MNWYKRALNEEQPQADPLPPPVQPPPQASGMTSTVTENKYGKFFNIYGNTSHLYNELKGLGFKQFRGVWGKNIKYITPEIEAGLVELGIDISPLHESLNPPTEPQQPQQSEVPELLGQMKAGVEKAVQEAKGNQRIKAILDTIDDTIESLANMVDETAAQKFIQAFLIFASKFHKYSFGNQMLIWAQRPDARFVAGATKWRDKLGRQVVDFSNPIHIIGPSKRKHHITDKEKRNLSPQDLKDLENKTYLSFIGLTVYDVADTQKIPDWKRTTKEGVELEPFDPEKVQNWQQDSNESVEELNEMVNAAYDFGRSMNIDVETEDLKGQGMSGYSAGGKIRIENTHQGINLFSTLVHELAHEILHWGEKSQVRNKKLEEVDAESTAYVVLKHYGFESKDSPTYLALLFKGKGKDVKSRREAIQKAVTTIITGIDKSMKARIGNFEYYD